MVSGDLMVLMVLVEVRCRKALIARVCCWPFGLGSNAIGGGGADVMVVVVIGMI